MANVFYYCEWQIENPVIMYSTHTTPHTHAKLDCVYVWTNNRPQSKHDNILLK